MKTKNNLEELVRIIVRETIETLKNPDQGWIFEGIFHEHKEWIIYEGDSKITTIFEDNSRLSFEIGYPAETWNEDKHKWKHKAASKWKTLAREIYNSTGLSEAGNPIIKPWRVCYQEALESPEMKEFIHKDAQPVFEAKGLTPIDDKGYPKEVQGKPAPCMDSVNFTSMG
jgi:hypothetical protein